MGVKLSSFMPETKQLLVDEDGDRYPEELKAFWVRVFPPTWEANTKRQELLASLYSKGPFFNDLKVAAMEIYLCFGGTNIDVEVPKRDEKGGYVWRKDTSELEPELEEITFSDNLDETEFLKRLGKLPSYVVELWHKRTLEVATQWSPSFQQQ